MLLSQKSLHPHKCLLTLYAPQPPTPALSWPVSQRLRQIYKDPETLVFRDPSPWRWADFTAHPRVLTVGDRTGVKMIDTQGPPGCGLLLFRGGAEAACQKGERVLLNQYLGECGPEFLQPTLHLICTQVSDTFSLLSLMHCHSWLLEGPGTTAGKIRITNPDESVAEMASQRDGDI